MLLGKGLLLLSRTQGMASGRSHRQSYFRLEEFADLTLTPLRQRRLHRGRGGDRPNAWVTSQRLDHSPLAQLQRGNMDQRVLDVGFRAD
jgi:hypothetical protein